VAIPTVDQIWADFNLDGSVHEPAKLEIRRYERYIQALAEAGVLAKGYSTKAAMDADTGQPDGTLGVIRADPVDANNFPTLWTFNDAGNVWVQGVDRILPLQDLLSALSAIYKTVDMGDAEQLVDPYGIVYRRVRPDGAHVIPGGAVLGDTQFEASEADATYALNIKTASSLNQIRLLRAGQVELPGALRFDYGDVGGYVLPIIDPSGVVLFGITANGDGGGGDGAAKDFVTWEEFDADPTGAVPSDAQIKAAHDYANLNNLRVVQKSGRFLWRAQQIDVRTDCDLSGATIVTDSLSGVATADFATDPPIFRVLGKPWVALTPSELVDLNTNYKAHLVKGGQYFPYPKAMLYPGGGFYYFSDERVMYRNASFSEPVYKRDISIIGQYGGMANQFVETLTTGSVTEAGIVQREDSWLTIRAPKFECAASRVWVGIQVERAMVRVNDLQDIYNAVGVADAPGRIGCKWKRGFAWRASDIVTRSHPSLGGSYVMQVEHGVDIIWDNFRAMYGWGMMGNTFAKDLTMVNSDINRFDFHWGAWGDITLKNSRLGNLGVRLVGGGRFIGRDIRYENWRTPGDPGVEGSNLIPAVVSFREDYGGTWEGEIDIQGLTIHFSPLTTFAPPSMLSTTSFDVLRLGYPAIPNVNGDIYMPEIIRIADVTFDLMGLTSLPSTLNLGIVNMVNPKATANVGKKTYLPNTIDIDGATAIRVDPSMNVMITGFQSGDITLNQDGARSALRPDGTNADITIRNIKSVLNAGEFIPAGRATLTIASDPATWASGYAAAVGKWVPRVVIEDCVPTLVEVGAKCAVDVRGGVLARVDTKTMGAADVRVKVTGADVQLAPTVDNGATTLSDPARVTFVGCAFFDHAWTVVANSGALRGQANINYIATPALWPNIPSTFWIP
jgi:hypothetical protein